MKRGWLALILVLVPLVPDAGAGPISSIREVRALPRAAALGSLPVEIESTVLYSDRAKLEAIIDDGTGSCYLRLNKNAPELRPGDRVRIRGVTWQFGLFPHVEADACAVTGNGPLPEPHRPGVDELFLPSLDSDWVEVPARVTGVESGGLAYTLVVDVFGHELKADLPAAEDANERALALMQRRVTMKAVAATVFNSEMQMAGRHFFVPSFDMLVPVSPPPEEKEALPLKTVEVLTGDAGPDRLVRLEGVVTLEDGDGFHLRDSSGSVFVQTSLMGRFEPGTQVRVMGFGRMAPYRPVILAAKVRPTGASKPPLPVRMDLSLGYQPAMHDELVAVEAEFLGLRHGQSDELLLCRSGGLFFEAVLPGGAEGQTSGLGPGDRIELRGICKLFTTHPMPRPEWVDGMRIHLAREGGIRLLRKAPWWTPERLLAALGTVALLLVIALGAVVLLRRRVAGQMAIIGGKLREEAVHLERDRIARELHDTLEQQLAGVAMQVDGIGRAALTNPSVLPERVSLARRMIRHTRAEARRSVWDLRSRTLQRAGLTAALRELCTSAQRTADGPEVVLEAPDRLPEFRNGADFHLLRIAQEALGNALKHASARRIVVALEVDGDLVTLSVSDDGVGFEHSGDAEDPAHFGLVGIRQRAEGIGASLAINSSPSNGTRVMVSLPIQTMGLE